MKCNRCGTPKQSGRGNPSGKNYYPRSHSPSNSYERSYHYHRGNSNRYNKNKHSNSSSLSRSRSRSLSRSRSHSRNRKDLGRGHSNQIQKRSSFGGPPGLFKETDWRCENCHNINFSWRSECNRCKYPRKEGGNDLLRKNPGRREPFHTGNSNNGQSSGGMYDRKGRGGDYRV